MDAEIYLDSRTKEQWEQVTKVIPKGFVCVELGENTTKIKVGNGNKTYSQLPYLSGLMSAEDKVKLDAFSGIEYGTEDLESGVSELETGKIYLVYE